MVRKGVGMDPQDAKAEDRSTRTSMMFGTNKISLRPVSVSVSVSLEAWFTARTPFAGQRGPVLPDGSPARRRGQPLRGIGRCDRTGPCHQERRARLDPLRLCPRSGR